MKLQLENQIVPSLPTVSGDQPCPRNQIAERRRERASLLGPLARRQIERRNPIALFIRRDESGGSVEVADDLEHSLVMLLGFNLPGQKSSDPMMHVSTLLLRDERIGRLLNTVVYEPIRVFRPNNQLEAE